MVRMAQRHMRELGFTSVILTLASWGREGPLRGRVRETDVCSVPCGWVGEEKGRRRLREGGVCRNGFLMPEYAGTGGSRWAVVRKTTL